jgi:cytochrome d ubiquinol oxidase subunit II
MSLADVLAGVIVVALNCYVLLGGADYGGGVWDLFASGARKGRQRELIAHAIGPVWEANHVWVILVVVLLFTCFPLAFARLGTTLHIPLTLLLVGVVLRGSAFTFRSYGGEGEQERHWGRVFAVASLVTPILLGVIVGAVASGGVHAPRTADQTFWSTYVQPWLTPFAFSVGLFALACFAFLAAVYLTVEARDDAVREDFRWRALVAGVLVFVTAAVALLFARIGAPRVWAGLLAAPWAIPLHLLTAAAAIGALTALWSRRWRAARIAAAAQVSLILWGWALAQFPYMIPPDLTIAAVAAPAVTLELVAGALGLGAVVLFPSLYYLFKIFKSAASAAS